MSPRQVIAAGAAIVTSAGEAGTRRVRLELLLQSSHSVCVSWHLLGRDRLELDDDDGLPLFRSTRHLRLRRMRLASPNHHFRRATVALGGGWLYYGTCRFTVAEELCKQSKYCGLRVRPSGHRGDGDLYVERRRCEMGLGKRLTSSDVAFLLTQDQVHDRINLIASNYGFRKSSGEADVNALSSLFLSLIGGHDTPLLWKTIGASDE